MDCKNTVFYVENGKFHISRYVLMAVFRLLIGSQRPDTWPDDMLLNRFERSIAFYTEATAGVYWPIFARAKSVSIEDWILTDMPLPRLETFYPQIPAFPDDFSSTDKVDDEDDSTLEATAPSTFFSQAQSEPTLCWKQRPKFHFSDFDIPPGSVLTFKREPSITVTTLDAKTGVVSDNHEAGSSWTDITRQLTGFPQVAPVDYWCYQGTPLRKLYEAKYGNSKKTKPSKKAQPTSPPKSEKTPTPTKKSRHPKSEIPSSIIKSSFDFPPATPVTLITPPGH